MVRRTVRVSCAGWLSVAFNPQKATPVILCILLSLVVLASIACSARSGAAELDLSTATLAELQAAMDKGALTSERLVELYLARIDAYDPKGPKLYGRCQEQPEFLHGPPDPRGARRVLPFGRHALRCAVPGAPFHRTYPDPGRQRI
jgi:hypothetical protein